MVILALSVTFPFALIVLIGWLFLRKIFPRNKPLLNGLASAGLAFWLSSCFFVDFPMRETVYYAKHTNRALYHFLKALGFSGNLSDDLMAMWNLLVLAFWLALLSGTITYWHTRRCLRQEKANRASELLL